MTSTHDWRRDRKSRKRGVTEDAPQEGGWSPPAQPSFGGTAPRRPSALTSSDPQYSAAVKRFDAERGFGFVVVDGGIGDAFLHISSLQRAGVDAVSPGMRLRVRVGQSERGPQVTEVLEVGGTDDAAPPAVVGRPAGITHRSVI